MNFITIGRVTIDRYYRGDELVDEYPGGSAYNVARWFEKAGYDSALAATIGTDFPEVESLDTDYCVTGDTETVTVDIDLEATTDANDRHVDEKGYEPLSLPSVNEPFDLSFLSSFEEPLLELFVDTESEWKAYDPGELRSQYEWRLVRRALEEADYVFVNTESADTLKSIASQPLNEFPRTFDIEVLVRTSKQDVRIFQTDGSSTYPVETISNVEDEVGAGDAFAARFLEGVVSHEPLDEMVEAAIERSRRTVMHVGSLPSEFL